MVVRGGRRITEIRVIGLEVESSVDPDRDDCLRVRLDREGDFSTYQVCLVDVEGIDPRYVCADLHFRLDCPADLDCVIADECEPDAGDAPELNYLAKDYASFRQLILDRLALTTPDWRERHDPDVGVTLVELLAYVGRPPQLLPGRGRHRGLPRHGPAAHLRTPPRPPSRLSHARGPQRASVGDRLDRRRHSPGAVLGVLLRDQGFGYPGPQPATPARRRAGGRPTGQLPRLRTRRRHGRVRPVPGRPERDQLAHLGDAECCLPAGATSATLRDSEPALNLEVGDVLVLEEVKGPDTGNPADADPTHRHAVRITRVTAGIDDLLGVRIVEVEWDRADALPFALCLSVRLRAPDCTLVEGVSVARGNVVLVDHGATLTEPLGPVGVSTVVAECACEGALVGPRSCRCA